MVSPQAKRAAVTVLMTERNFGVTRACGLVGISRSLYRYRSRRPDSAPLRARIEEIAAAKRRYGYRRVYLRLRREGWEVNRKRVYRLYREAGVKRHPDLRVKATPSFTRSRFGNGVIAVARRAIVRGRAGGSCGL